MPELILGLGLLLTVLLYRRLKTPIGKAFCIILTLLFTTGHVMNILAVRLNGNQMPVIEDGLDWDGAPSIPVPDAVNEVVFEKYLPTAQKTMLLTEKVHRFVKPHEIDDVRLKFLVDRFPVKIGGNRSIYSIGDVFIAFGMALFFVGILPIWLIARSQAKRLTP